jgi:hypothetical protein
MASMKHLGPLVGNLLNTPGSGLNYIDLHDLLSSELKREPVLLNAFGSAFELDHQITEENETATKYLKAVVEGEGHPGKGRPSKAIMCFRHLKTMDEWSADQWIAFFADMGVIPSRHFFAAVLNSRFNPDSATGGCFHYF